MPNVPYLSDEDVRALRELARQVRSRPMTLNRPPHTDPEEFTPEQYLARSPSTGIPALSAGPGTGTGDDLPGSAECSIYRPVGDPVDDVIPMGFSHRVLNFARARVDPNIWIIIARDKPGYWYIIGAADGVGLDFGTGTGTHVGGACRESLGGLPLDTIPGFVEGAVQLLGHDANGCLRWYDVGQC